MNQCVFNYSVVTSVSIVENKKLKAIGDENKKVKEKPKRKDKTPKFEFYLYNDAGRIIKQYLSIHEIQQILLQQSQNLGENCLAYKIFRLELPLYFVSQH